MDETAARVKQQVDKWRDDLIDLSRRNRLLNYRPTKVSTLTIRAPGPIEVMTRLLASRSTGWRFYEPAVDEQGQPIEPATPAKSDELVTDVTTPKQLANSLKGLNRRATDEFLDKGLHILFLAVGMLEWLDVDETKMRSPLLLFPVDLEQASPGEPYRLALAEDDPVVNPALSVKLAADFDIGLPDAEDVDEAESDIRLFLDQVASLCSSRRGWAVTDSVVLSFFSFHKHAMYRDLLENAAAINEHDLVQVLALGDRVPDPSALDFDPVAEDRLDLEAPPEKLASILDADATQRQCIVAARDGRSFVMDGPPGTGKSQTIANMIAELLAENRTVLFVSEKAAALEVVDKRLKERGLHHFVLELHSHKATRKEVARTLGAALEERPRAREEFSDADLRRLQTDREQLSAYASAHNRVRFPLGRSVHWAIGRSAQLRYLPDLAPARDISETLTAEALSDLMDAADDLSLHWQPVEQGADFLWRDLADPADARVEIDGIDHSLGRASALLDDLFEASASLADILAQPAPQNEADVRWLITLADHVAAAPADLHRAWLFADEIDSIRMTLHQRHAQAAAHQAILTALNAFTGAVRQPAAMPAETARTILALLQSLQSLGRTPTLGPTVPGTALAAGAEAAGEVAPTVSSMLAAFDTIVTAFGWRGQSPWVGTLRDAVTLARLSASEIRPDPEWIRRAVLDQVRSAVEVLQPIIEAFRGAARDLDQTFEPSALNLDLQPILAGGKPRLSRLSGAGRANRKALAAQVKGGKITKEAVGRLTELVSWQQVARRLREAEVDHGRMIGDHYYAGTSTDFASLAAAIGCADQALAIVGTADPKKLAAALCEQRDEALIDAAAELERLTDGWERELLPALAACGIDLADTPADVTAERVAPLREPLAQLQTAIASVDGLARLSIGQLRQLAQLRAELDDAEGAFEVRLKADREVLGDRYAGLETDWEVIHKLLLWVVTLRSLLGRPVGSELEADSLTPPHLAVDPVRAALTTYQLKIDEVLGPFAAPRASVLRQELSVSFDDARELLADLRNRVADIETWAVYTERCRQLRAGGLSELLDEAATRRVPAAQLTEAAERAVLQAWLAATDRVDGNVKLSQSGEDRDELVHHFRQLDARVTAHAVSRVVTACAGRRPNSDAGAAGVIRRQAALQRRHLPIRRLLEQAGDVAQVLKPCFMMSPLSVSTFLPPTMRFDVVIFDEASQVRPCDAINAIYRGRQLVVAGDRHQLPPTSYFDRVAGDADDVYDEEKLDEFESVLDLAKGSPGIRSLPLRWHYRSRHESLITYSNAAIYTPNQHPLITYPSAVDHSDQLGVELFHIPDARYGRGKGSTQDNPKEAAAVVERVLHYATAYPDVTVGVVAFSEAQAQRILDELDIARTHRPELDPWFSADRLDGFFVKNLENVQGDERDVIIFSVGYGYDDAGKLTLNFGPLNKPGGYRRLNVAITRARSRVEVVTSIRHRDIDQQTQIGANTNPGVRHLRDYLAYAAEGLQALTVNQPSGEGEPESPFEESVMATVRSWGWDVVSQVGQAGYRIDLGVRHPDRPGEFLFGIECDGWAYHSSPVARDRDRLRQEVLEGLGWRLHRIWGTAWYRRRQHEESRLQAALEAARTGNPPAARPRSAPTAPVQLEVEQVNLAAPPTWTVPYQVAVVSVPRGLAMDAPGAQRDLDRVVRVVVDVEGPVALSVLKNRARDAFRAGRVGANMQAALDWVVNALVRSGSVIKSEAGFLDIPGRTVETVRHPVDDPASQRSVDQIAVAEIDLAILHLVADARSIDIEELKTRIRSVFGFERTGRLIDARIQSCVDRLARDGPLTQDQGTIRKP